MTTTNTPQGIRALTAKGMLEIDWGQGRLLEIPFHTLRCACPCARCVDEMTGIRVLKPETVPKDIKPTSLAMTGNYALKVSWSDGHDTGIFTWERLSGMTVE